MKIDEGWRFLPAGRLCRKRQKTFVVMSAWIVRLHRKEGRIACSSLAIGMKRHSQTRLMTTGDVPPERFRLSLQADGCFYSPETQVSQVAEYLTITVKLAIQWMLRKTDFEFYSDQHSKV
ncbi:MAG: hypothetical protein A2Z25_03340 [Planctomycetes bacterium RBG_16_55_9]|nr:MAG: hypothetical protein A2Z25_03340 [Planctomycetes bacterium RBG_16_55_9]